MTEVSAQRFLSSRPALWVVSLLLLVFFLVTNLPWQLEEYSQDRQALVSFEMLKEGHWLYQRAPRSLRFEKEATKPPLIGWISTLLYLPIRSWDVAWRLPSLLAAVLLGVLLWRNATDVYGAAAGLLALGAFGLNQLTPRLATLVRTDMPLALIVFLAGLEIWNKVRRSEEWTRRDRWILFSVLTVGLYIKGPIVFAFLLPGVALFRGCRPRNTTNAWPGWWPWFASFGIFLIWVIGGIVTQPGFFDQVVMHEFLGRFEGAEQRPHPPYFYLAHLFQKFAPWSELMILFLFFSLIWAERSFRESWRKLSPATSWLLFWSLGGFLLLSLVPSKRIDRIFPVIPPLCLVLAAQIRNGFPNERAKQVWRWSAVALVFAILFTSDYCVSRIIEGYRNHADALAQFGRTARREAASRGWRYAVVTSHDGGLLLYVGKTQFVQPNDAIAEWRAGNLDALIAEASQAPVLMRDLPAAVLSDIKGIGRVGRQNKSYVLIVRRPGEVPDG